MAKLVDKKLGYFRRNRQFEPLPRAEKWKLSTKVGENFEIYMSQMAKNALKLSTMVAENFEIYLSQMAKNALKKYFWDSNL